MVICQAFLFAFARLENVVDVKWRTFLAGFYVLVRIGVSSYVV